MTLNKNRNQEEDLKIKKESNDKQTSQDCKDDDLNNENMRNKDISFSSKEETDKKEGKQEEKKSDNNLFYGLSIPSEVLDIVDKLEKDDKGTISSYIIKQYNYEKKLIKNIENEKNEKLLQAANAENSRKQSLKEIEKAKKYSLTKFAEQLLSILDTFGQCVKFIDDFNIKENNLQDKDVEDNINNQIKIIFDGIKKTKSEFVDVLKKNAITEIHIIKNETKFDSSKHMAVSSVQTKEHENDTIANVMRSGYMIGDRCLRASMVSIYKNNS